MGNKHGGALFSTVAARITAIFTIFLVIVISVVLGMSLAENENQKNHENFVEFAPALPTKILDINGTLITEFASDEKRELVSLSELPRHLIYAVLAREDPDFYNHRGFSLKAIARAAWGQIIDRSMGGGSTITQQVSGTLYTDRREMTIRRKIKELWWAFQVERRYTKNEILEIYLNYMPMGPGTYGVETASKYFFDHSAREVTLAESAILAVLLSSPSRFNPLNNPNEAMDRQRFVLDRMIEFGFTTPEEAEASFTEYWDNFDYTRASVSAYFSREDKAPWFSEYVRRELDSMMYGSMDYYRDGFVVHTTMDLNHQEAAERFMAEGLEKANRGYAKANSSSNTQAERTYNPIIDMLTLVFDLTDIRAVTQGQNERRAVSRYTKTLNPVVDMAALVFGIPEIKDITGQGFAQLRVDAERNVVEGALISIENETGYITAIVGGSKYDQSNQLIRATQANVQYGSAFKPLYYSAAIDSRQFTAGSLIYDIPIVFHNNDGTPYIPLNFRGEWRGSVLLYEALAHSMNVPSIKILDTIGFDAAIDRASALLDFTDTDQIRRLFPRVYPLGLGVTASSPLRLARAFATFGNQGRAVTPIAIRSVEDRNGRVVFDVERELRQRQRRQGDSIQVVSPQNAYIMTKILEKTVEQGSLANASGWGSKFTFKDENGRNYKLPVAGKTGTPQNWSDAWAVGYSPYYTTSVWFGFDKPGNSLGVDLTGATLAGPVWSDYMRDIHRGLPRKDFARPSSGIVEVTVCAKSGLLKTANCNEGEITLPFLEGTQPVQYCDIHGGSSEFDSRIPIRTVPFTGGFDESEFLDSLTMPQLPPDLLLELEESARSNRNQTNSTNQPSGNTSTRNPRNRRTPTRGNTSTNTRNNTRANSNNAAAQPSGTRTQTPAYNPFLDDDLPQEPPLFGTQNAPLPAPAPIYEPQAEPQPAVLNDAPLNTPPPAGLPPNNTPIGTRREIEPIIQVEPETANAAEITVEENLENEIENNVEGGNAVSDELPSWNPLE